MSLRRWFRERMLGGDDSPGDDAPPGSALVNTLIGREEPRVRTLGEYDSSSYPAELLDQLTRREAVVRDLLRMDGDIVDPEDRIAAIPTLRSLLRRYPHPLVYEALINAYLDAQRFDEARGVVFAARQRRADCLRSPYPEIRAELEGTTDWTVEQIDELSETKRGRGRRRKRR